VSQPIDRRYLPLNALRAFEAVGRHLSFTAAAQSLSVAQSAVSRHVISLEERLGVALFERRPHQLVLTEAGQKLLPAVAKSFERIDQALTDIVQDKGRRVRSLKVQIPPTFAYQLAVPLLHDFRRICPDIIFDIETPNDAGPPAREVDLALCYTKPEVTAYVANLLRLEQLTPVCHPDLARRHAGTALADFLDLNELLHVRLESEPRHVQWDLFARQNGLTHLSVERGLVFDTSMLAMQYALSGDGVALLDARMFESDIAAGRLIAPFSQTAASGYGYYLHIHPEDLDDPVIGLFRSWIIERFAGGAGP
jgi:DNA-binding transcriptional LysR family regulator